MWLIRSGANASIQLSLYAAVLLTASPALGADDEQSPPRRQPLLRSWPTTYLAASATCGNGVVESPAEECEPGLDGMGQPLDTNCPGRCIAAGEGGQCTCFRPCNINDCEFCELSYGLNGPLLTHGGLFYFIPQAPYALIETCGSDYDTEISADIASTCDSLVWYNDECADTDCGGQQHLGTPISSCYQTGCNCLSQTKPGCPLASCMCVPTPIGQPYRFNVGESLFTITTPPGSNTFVRISPVLDCAQGPVAIGACCDHDTGTCEDGVLQPDCQGNATFTADAACAEVSCSANVVPSTSQWSLTTLGLLVLIAGTVTVGCTRRPVRKARRSF